MKDPTNFPDFESFQRFIQYLKEAFKSESEGYCQTIWYFRDVLGLHKAVLFYRQALRLENTPKLEKDLYDLYLDRYERLIAAYNGYRLTLYRGQFVVSSIRHSKTFRDREEAIAEFVSQSGADPNYIE